jgi:hypothetical protein
MGAMQHKNTESAIYFPLLGVYLAISARKGAPSVEAVSVNSYSNINNGYPYLLANPPQ